MTQISLDASHNLHFYGNWVGVVKGTAALVDPLFNSQELVDYLAKANLEIEWQEGLYEQLLSGNEVGLIAGIPQTKCRIWQLKPELPMAMRFIPFDQRLKAYGLPQKADYAIAYEANINTEEPEEVYQRFAYQPFPNGCRALAISDLIEIKSHEYHAVYYVNPNEFKKFQWV